MSLSGDAQHRDIRQACPVPPSERSFSSTKSPYPTLHEPGLRSGDEEDLVRVRVFDFGPRRKPANVDVALIGRIRAGDKTGLIGNRNAVRNITLGWFYRSGGRGLSGRSFNSVRRRRGWSVLIRLRLRRVFTLRRSGRVLGWRFACRPNRRLILAGGKEGHDTDKSKRERKFHKVGFDESLSVVIHCALADNR